MKKKKVGAVFLDRDGTIIRHVDYLTKLEQVRLLPRAAEAIKKLNKAGIPVFIHTNQPVIARGWLTEDELAKMHDVLLDRLHMKGAHITAVYYCPHHPEGDLPSYRMKCDCRKPGTAMFVRAAKEFNIDLKKSILMGDQTQDILAGHRAGMRAVLLRSGRGGKDKKFDVRPDHVASTLFEGAQFALKQMRI